MHDGSITFSTALDNAQLEKELIKLKARVFKLEGEVEEKEYSRNVLIERRRAIEAEINELKKSTNLLEGDSFADTSAAEAKMAELRSHAAGLQKEIEKYDAELNKSSMTLDYSKLRYGEILQMLDRLQQAEAERLRPVEEARETTNAAFKDLERAFDSAEEAIVGQAAQRLQDISDNAQVADQRIVDLADELSRLKARMDELRAAGVGIGYEEYDQTSARISEINSELREYQNNLLGTGRRASKAADGVKKATKYTERFAQRIKGILASAFIFNILSAGLRQFTSWVGKSIKTNSEARQSVATLKGALLTLAQPLVEVIIPAFTMLVNVLARVVTAMAQLVSTLFGKTLKQSKDGAKALYKEASGIQAVGDAAKDAMGSLAGFDEINTIDTKGSKGGGGGTGGLSGDAIKPDFKGLIGDELDKITALVSGALLAIGAILAFSGVDIPLGLALMAAGAAGLASVIFENWGAIVEALRGPIGLVTALVSGALLAIGVLLLFSGINIPLGLALIAVGALGLAAVVAANWETIQQVLEGPVGAVTALVSSALLAIGVLLAFSGVNLPLGLALIAAGAIGLVAAIAANWDTVRQALEGPTGAVTGLISGLLLALGAILLFSGANVPLGLGLLASGAIGLVASIAANWEAVQNALKGPVGTITALISSALLVLGAVLLFTGAATPLGLGLVAAGAVGLATSIAANWNTVQNALRGPIGAITALVSGALLVLGIILLFTGAGIPLALGLLALGATGLAATIAPNWDFVLDAIKGAWRNVKNWWETNAAKFFTLDYWKNLGKDIIDGFLSGLKKAWDGLANWFSGVWDSLFGNRNVSVGVSGTSSAGNYNSSSRMMYQSVPEVSNASIPLLAQGAVIPPNREFMAVLGDQRSGNNLEAPEALIRKIVREESGRGDTETTQLLQAILSAIKDGHIIMVDGTVFGRTAIRAINSITVSSGRQQLKL